ncbi:type IV toxin-antitoxin system AbiEi family antitoxin domain-containing protein [Xanthobacter dioxanivorans]|uniref:Type IV toxin-antitoxin system AbiEi family antitoxin domain-containing protein n=2 Tax=Xanthobacter dioxanivorans TaxID=2528964 RepID=A0A974PUI6_9HYPH|nr:type IV toxin-antitoxin system AbiEi family antitoxin domain-containing protein [Xanthobacter dioxanivorans]
MAGRPRTFLRSSPHRSASRAVPRFLYVGLCQERGRWLPGVGEDANYEFSISLLPTTPELPKMRKRDRDRAEALRLAGGPKPSLRDRAVALANERGVVRTRDLTDIGVPRCYLARMCEEGLLIKVGYGQYRAADRQAA